MNLYLLDAGGAGLFFGMTIVFMIIAIVVEAVIMLVMKYNSPGKCFFDSFIANLGSLVVGYILLFTGIDMALSSDSTVLNLVLLFGLTVVLEFGILFLLNRKQKTGRTFLVSVIMNIASYIILYLLIIGFDA